MRILLGMILLVALLSALMAFAAPPPPVMQNLGQMEPTPQPTAEPFEKRRLISTITVRNSPQGETMLLFEAMDFGDAEEVKVEDEDRKVEDEDSKEKEFKTLAWGQYTLSRESEEHTELRDRVLQSLRTLERDLLKYVEVAGPPKEREPVSPGDKPY